EIGERLAHSVLSPSLFCLPPGTRRPTDDGLPDIAASSESTPHRSLLPHRGWHGGCSSQHRSRQVSQVSQGMRGLRYSWSFVFQLRFRERISLVSGQQSR